MATYKLKRRYFEHGTFSTLEFKDQKLCEVVERPWLNNKPGHSCIPEGKYTISPHDSNKFGYCYIVHNAELGVGKSTGLRTHILIHKANLPSELQGCLAPGTRFGSLKGEWGVINSKGAFDALMQEFGGEEHALIIEEARK